MFKYHFPWKSREEIQVRFMYEVWMGDLKILNVLWRRNSQEQWDFPFIMPIDCRQGINSHAGWKGTETKWVYDSGKCKS